MAGVRAGRKTGVPCGVPSRCRADAGGSGSVYAARLGDFYWWENHKPERLYLALRDINQRMRQAEQ